METTNSNAELAASIEQIILSISSKFNLAIVPPEEVKAECDQLREWYKLAAIGSERINLAPLFPLLQKRSGSIAAYVFSFLEDVMMAQSNIRTIVEAMLSARDKALAFKALEITVWLTENGKLKVTRPFVRFLAGRIEMDHSYFTDKNVIDRLSKIVKQYKPGIRFHQSDPIMALYLEEDNLDIRKLAAKILDAKDQHVKQSVIELLFGRKIAAFFSPFFVFTNASYTDLLCVQPEKLPALKNDFIDAKAHIGDKLLCKVISKIGWDRINLGIEVEALIGISIGNSPPFMVSDLEARLMEKCEGVRRTSKLYLILAYGGQITDEQSNKNENDPINRFRAYNLNHASLLSDFLDVGPLTLEKVNDIIHRMDQIVKDYVALFNHISDECSILPGVYQKIKNKIEKELDSSINTPQFSPNLTRLVQSFEEPKSISAVRTLHGLKRYLHQNGLRMGFKLAVGGRSPNRTVDIVIATDEGVKFVFSKIRFADFEPYKPEHAPNTKIPYTVKLLVDGFTRQMLHGQEKFPNVDIFCYGNEVHYYFGFRNHPAFLRIDYAPPLRGGMIDLEYFGVSNYELDQHPNISLDAMKAFFQRIEFEIQIDAVHIHARYDKERALTLGDLCQKATQVFQMAPYFMDLDWIIGSLALDRRAKQKVADAWIDFFLHWGVLPANAVLSKNRTDILVGNVHGPTGQHEKIWSGEGKYLDLYTHCPPAGSYKNMIYAFREEGLDISDPTGKESKMHPGQLDLERRILVPLKLAIERGELIQSENAIQLQSPTLFIRVHETEIFAELLNGESDAIAASIATARLVRPLERIIKFNTSGSINGYVVQKAVLALRGEEITFFVLRGSKDMIRLAFFIRDQVVYKRRISDKNPWISNASYDAMDLARLLKANDFIDTLPKINSTGDRQKAATFLEEIQQSVLPPGKPPLRGDRIVTGLKASPGNTVGKALFGTEGRNPQDFRGSILVATSIRPEDTTYLYYANGIISTGGGILSHAGLIAMQFGKPALIISGKWQTDANGRIILMFKSIEYKILQNVLFGFNVSIRTDIQEKEYTVREGDLMILDASAGNMRILGQDTNILGLYEGFRSYYNAKQMLAIVTNEREILRLRGKLLRSRHQLEHILKRSYDPVLTRYAIFEILLNKQSLGNGMSFRDKYFLLSILLENQHTANDAREYLIQIMIYLKSRFTDSVHKATHDMPTSEYVFEILFLRLDIEHQLRKVESASTALEACGINSAQFYDYGKEYIESLVANRLGFLKRKLLVKIKYIFEKGSEDFRLRHLLRQLDRLKSLLPLSQRSNAAIDKIRAQIDAQDTEKSKKFANHLIIESNSCGFELYNYIGWKAANLAEIEHLCTDDIVPPWFVVTDNAFNEMMKCPVMEMDEDPKNVSKNDFSLREAIEEILSKEELNNQQKSIQIRNLWEQIQLPDVIANEVIEAYRTIVGESNLSEKSSKHDAFDYVAVRSSSLEEDTEAAAHAGEFETFLYIQGNEQLLYYLKRTWSGLWTERAIHNRTLLGSNEYMKGGGVIVQRMVNSRVSGVLQTVNIPKGNIREMVINAGLGLGEGVVSGVVAADQITVTKGIDPEKELLRFSYITSDKTSQISFNQHAGFGTIRTQTIYHQRLRPAMEYVELCQLVRYAASLEKAYGYPLDIEFGIEDDHLWILQARPVASFVPVLNETIERFPLSAPEKHYKT